VFNAGRLSVRGGDRFVTVRDVGVFAHLGCWFFRGDLCPGAVNTHQSVCGVAASAAVGTVASGRPLSPIGARNSGTCR